MNNNAHPSGRAVVIGASMAGLLAARVLADHFTQVTVVERDVLPPPGVPRKGVPQGQHAHVLLARGRELLEGFFPGLTQELAAQGAVAGDLAQMGRWFSGGMYQRHYVSGMISVQASRPLLEGAVFERLCAMPNVTVLQNHDAAGLVTTPATSGNRVTGVRVTNRVGANPVEETLPADLVVDAGGRGSRGLAWLESLGYPSPEEEQIKMKLAYTTRIFQRLPEHAGGHSPVVVLPGSKVRRGGAMLAAEGERWIVTLAGFLGDTAPTELDGFIEFARTLEAPDVYDVVKAAQPLGEASQYKYPASQRRRFEKMARFPEGFLVCGDALCSFNPVYGQGMTTAAGEAFLLGECLGEGLPGIGRRFFRRASRLLDSPWAISAGSDLAIPEVEGKRIPAMRLFGMYIARYNRAALEDTDLAAAFFKVTNLMNPPASLLSPRLMLRVARGNLRRAAHGSPGV